ncbi:MAG: N-acetylglucosamine-6-phosphate deacetylase [Clostridia bacterium]|nr:N-acetylglucosamine-6-phosphate deacetylase [Clostridia bacterium]
MKGFKNAKTYLRGKGIVRVDIGFENGRITEIGEDKNIQPIADTGDCLLVAGFIDEHIHGAGGADTMDGTAEALSIISKTLAKEGTTAFLATTMTQSDDKIKNALKGVAQFKECGGARLLGAHLEGPFISGKYVGAQPPEYVVKPDIGYFKELQRVAGNKIKLVTLAPEEDDCSLIEYLNKIGVTVSVGHSNATERQVCEAMQSGLTCVTHTFNAQSPLHHREAGVVGSALLHNGLFCEVIADTIHVSVPALKLLIKNKPKDKPVLITDSIRAKGEEVSVSELGGQTVYVKDGQARLKDGTLAGSVLKMNEAVRNLVTKCGTDIGYAVDCATYNPAKNLGIENEYGIIKEGAFADFTLLDENFNVVLTVVGGEIVYRA